MQELMKMAASPNFWVGSILVGFLLNLGTTYFVRALDRYIPAWSEKRKQATSERMKMIAKIHGDIPAITLLFSRAAEKNSNGAYFMGVSVFFLILSGCSILTRGLAWPTFIPMLMTMTTAAAATFSQQSGSFLASIAKAALKKGQNDDAGNE